MTSLNQLATVQQLSQDEYFSSSKMQKVIEHVSGDDADHGLSLGLGS